MIVLREYQREALNAIPKAFESGMRAPLVVMPTGSGKAPTLCTFLKETLHEFPDQRIVSLVHVRELVEQNAKTLFHLWPEAPMTICSAGLNSRNVSGQIVMASIQSIYKRAYDLQRVDLVVVDEAHLIPPAGEGMYRRLLEDLATINRGPLPLLGFTATAFRLQSGSLVDGKGKVFDGIAYEVGLKELIEQGYLSPPITKPTKTDMDGSGVATRGGEFVAGGLQEKYDREHITKAACAELVEHGAERRSWLVFSTGVQHAFHIRDEIRRLGFSCETVTGDTPLGDRARIINAFKAGQIRCLTNDSVLTTGFDSPQIDLIGLMRPTKSAGLLLQMVGRGTRLAHGKDDCLILDYGRNLDRFGPIDQITARVKRGDAPPPMKICPECETYILAAARECEHCGHEFPIEPQRQQHVARASTAPVISNQAPQWLDVSEVRYFKHEKPGGTPSLRVEYRCGLTIHKEWVCLQHGGGRPRNNAITWWRARSSEPAPIKVDQALPMTPTLRRPARIAVRRVGKYHEVVDVEFMPDVPAPARPGLGGDRLSKAPWRAGQSQGLLKAMSGGSHAAA